MRELRGSNPEKSIIPVLLICLISSAVVFYLDMSVPLGIAMGLMYSPMIWIAATTNNYRYPIYMAALGSILIIIAYFFAPTTEASPIVIANRLLSVAILSLFAFILSRTLRAEATLEKTLQRLQFHLSNSPLALVQWDSDFSIKTWSSNAESLFGWSAEEVVGVSPVDFNFIHEEDREHVGKVMGALMQGIGRNIVSNRNYTKDGRIVHSKWHSSVLKNRNGEVLSILSLVEDCTAAAHTQETLRKSEAYAKAVLETAVDGIITINIDGTISSANPAVEKIFGYKQEELLGNNVNMLMPQPYHSQHDQYLVNYLKTGTAKIIGKGRQVSGKRKDGSEFPMELSISEVIIEGNHSFTGIVRDITEQKHAQAVLEAHNEQLARQEWLQTGLSGIHAELRGELNPDEISAKAIGFICRYLDAQLGACYLKDEDGNLNLAGSYAYQLGKAGHRSFAPGEGLIGQAMLEGKPILINSLPQDYIAIESGLGETSPSNLFIVPILHEDKVIGVMEIGKLKPIGEPALEFVNQAIESIGAAIFAAQTSKHMNELLERLQNQSAELTSQSRELTTINKELESQAQQLRRSEQHLKHQREELKATNERLEDKTLLLNAQKDKAEQNNIALEETRLALETKAKQLERTSTYKSQFLANMSHELRTPLNSMLILAQSLAQNDEGNLTEEEIRCASVIHDSGKDLLRLINEILDLSKIEAGHIELHLEPTSLPDIVEGMKSQFQPVADDKKVEFSIHVQADLPKELITDEQRLSQILKNLLSNAFKFTDRGIVKLDISSEPSPAGDELIKFKITDTGEGIQEHDQPRIFEAFQQVDGSTSRKYAGTGLGLSISRDLANLLGGGIELQSEPGVGSTFTLSIPFRVSVSQAAEPGSVPESDESTHSMSGQSDEISAPENSDINYDSLITLGNLPEEQGKATHGIHQLNGKSILIVDDDVRNSFALCRILKNNDVNIKLAENGEAAVAALKNAVFDIVLMDMMMPVMDGYTAIGHIRNEMQLLDLPIVALTANAMKEDRVRCMESGADAYISKPVDIVELQQVIDSCLKKRDAA